MKLYYERYLERNDPNHPLGISFQLDHENVEHSRNMFSISQTSDPNEMFDVVYKMVIGKDYKTMIQNLHSDKYFTSNIAVCCLTNCAYYKTNARG